jgi:hypothetical protein
MRLQMGAVYDRRVEEVEISLTRAEAQAVLQWLSQENPDSMETLHAATERVQGAIEQYDNRAVAERAEREG